VSSATDTATQQTRLASLAVELRIATTVAVAHDAWFAPTLDDCRLDVERMQALDAESVAAAEAAALIARSEAVLRTWRRIVAVTGVGKLKRECRDCGGGLVDVARPGRMIPFRGAQVEVPAQLEIPTCDRCGAESLDAPSAARLDAALFSAYVTPEK
jgi:hypothetical protein